MRLIIPRPQRCKPPHSALNRKSIVIGGAHEFASDNPYADLDDDGVPELAIGRITAHSREELGAILKKILAYEDSRDFGAWRTHVNCVVGQAGLGSLSESLGESFVRSLIGAGIPAEYQTTITSASWASPFCPNPHQFHQCCLDRMNEGSLFWVFMGHGNPRTLQWAMFPDHNAPILWSEDCPACTPNRRRRSRCVCVATRAHLQEMPTAWRKNCCDHPAAQWLSIAAPV